MMQNALKNQKLAHAYLFYGEHKVDLEEPILAIIKLLLDTFGKVKISATEISQIQHLNFQMIQPSADGLITKESVNKVLLSLYETSSIKDGLKILYIKNVDLGNKFSLNALLKFIEEPVNNLIILMSTNHFDQVLSTIKSRTQNVYVRQPNLSVKVEQFQKHVLPQHAVLLSQIYQNIQTLKTINLELFLNTHAKLLSILEAALKQPYGLKPSLNQLWTKNNSDFICSILQFFYYQAQIAIDPQWPLFPEHQNLVLAYQKQPIDYPKMQKLISHLQQALKQHANFNLQKQAFLVQLEQEYLIALNVS